MTRLPGLVAGLLLQTYLILETETVAFSHFLKRLGVDEVIDYNMVDFEKVVSDIDLVLDTIGGETQLKSIEVLKEGGRLITTLAPEYVAEAKAKNVHLGAYMAQSVPAQLIEIGKLIDNGKIKPVVDQVFTLTDAKKAQIESEKGHTRGKIVLQVM